MNKKLYDLMDWAEIETIVYSEHDHPEQTLGPRRVHGGILIQTFLPGAKTVFLKNKRDGKLYQMEEADEAGFFAVFLYSKKVPPYEFIARYEDGTEYVGKDAYYYAHLMGRSEWEHFPLKSMETYQRMGAHPVSVVEDGQSARIVWEGTPKKKKGETSCRGTYFAVCAPYAMRVSVVGDFNHWDGRVHPMIRMGDSNVFALFLPEVHSGELYKFEVKWNATKIELWSDPYAFDSELPPSDAGIVAGIGTYEWNDRAWMEKRKKDHFEKSPMSVYEVYLDSWRKDIVKKNDSGEEYTVREYMNYREIASELATHMKELGYTHVELLPVMEHISEESLGYETSGYFAPTARHGRPEDFRYFVDHLHQNGIGVILDWPAVGKYCREGADAADFLIDNALFWKNCYHADGLRVTGMESIVRLDYGKEDGKWLPNRYGGREDLDGMEFLKKLSAKFHEAGDGALLIAEDASAFPQVTDSVENGGLGFDLKWNGGWTGDFLEYMKIDPLFRKGSHSKLLDGMLYAYSERFVLAFSHNQAADGQNSMLARMPGELTQKIGNLRIAIGYMMTHPGKKLLYLGQEFIRGGEWEKTADSSWAETERKAYLGLQNYARCWNQFYCAHPALYEQDYDESGFEWISCLDADHSIIVFMRRGGESGEELLIVCNFTPVLYENFRVGVPCAGTYREIFNSDCTNCGGTGFVNPKRVMSKEVGWDGREHSVSITVPPLGVSVFQCIPDKEEEPAKPVA